MNPFKFGQVVWGEDFCGRTRELKSLKQNIRSGQNTYLQGERRIGKSSLIKEAIRTSRGFNAITVDLLEMKSIENLCKEMIRGIISVESKASFVEKTLRLLSGFRPAVTFDPLTNSWSISLSPSLRFTDESIVEILDVIEVLGEKKKIVVVLDEFQDIMKIKEHARVLAVLRGKIQHHNPITYLFAGSLRSSMDQIFIHPDSPFFKSAVAIDVGHLEENLFKEFIRRKFSVGRKTINEDTLSEVFRIAEKNPGDTLQLCRALWDVTADHKAIKLDSVAKALDVIFAQEAKGYHLILNAVTHQQLKCLIGLAKIGGRQVTSRAFIAASGIPLPASIKQAINRLENIRIVFKKENEYRFFNPFFRAWLLAHKA